MDKFTFRQPVQGKPGLTTAGCVFILRQLAPGFKRLLNVSAVEMTSLQWAKVFETFSKLGKSEELNGVEWFDAAEQQRKIYG